MKKDAVIINKYYEYFEQLEADALNWSLDFRQLSAGEKGHHWLQLSSGDFGFINPSANCSYDQRAIAPAGLRTFSILAENRAPSYWCDRAFGWNTLVSMPVSDEFTAVSKGFFSNYIFSINEQLLAVVAEQQFHADWTAIEPSQAGAAYEIWPEDAKKIRRLLSNFSYQVKNYPDHIKLIPFKSELAACLIRALINSVHPLLVGKAEGRPAYVRIAREYIESKIMDNITVSDLCGVVGVSERTLEYSFKEVYGLTPKAYMLRQRLAKVHKELLYSNPLQDRVGMISASYNFWHTGQFAKDYRNVYGVTARSTLNTTL